jgi:hypothetical protein
VSAGAILLYGLKTKESSLPGRYFFTSLLSFHQITYSRQSSVFWGEISPLLKLHG